MRSENIQSSFIKSFRSHIPVRTWCTNEKAVDDAYWTFDLCKAEASRYLSSEEWAKGSPASYKKAMINCWITKCTAHISNFRRPPAAQSVWTLAKCLEVGRQCKSRSEFKKRFHYPYEKARLNGWLEICCAHMV
mgnify:FL=1